ncbi:MAG TPA: DEAD/DEAH box helicase [Myxococcaceae bacterium]|nr:DEAD/DEAH box helicase [Myxococcaceae bacterium]
MSATSTLLEAIREEARPGIWSTGVSLARKEAVVLESRAGDEVTLRVRAPGRPVALSVTLYPKDDAWECDCPSRVDPCEHVVAAAIALNQAETQATPLTTAENRWTRVVYRLSRMAGGLFLQRTLAHADGSESPLEGSLASRMARPAEAAQLQVEACDLQADRLLEKPTRLALPPERLDALLQILEPARNVLLDGRPIAVSGELVFPRAVVEDRGAQIAVTVDRDPRITELVSPGVALCGDALCRLGETALSGSYLQNLPTVRTFSAEQVGELSARFLPELARRIPVDVRSRRLPPLDRDLQPRVTLELTRLESGLSVLPTLVYGSPPSVRIDNGRMTYLRGAVPLRDEAAEQRWTHQLRDALNLVVGRRTTVQGAELTPFVDKLRKWRGGLSGDAAGLVSPNARLVPDLKVDAGTRADGVPDVGFALSFRVEGGAGEGANSVEAADVLRAWSEGLGLVPIAGGGWAPLPTAWLEKYGTQVAELLAARREDGHVANHVLPQLGALCDALDSPRPPGLERLAPLVEGFERIPEAPLPDDLTATLRAYQRQGVNWLTFLRAAGLGGVLADDMGLGKTLQTLCVLGPRSLVVCPTSVLPNWEAEVKRFRPSLRVSVYHGPGRGLDPSADITLTTYALLRLDAAQLGAQEWNAVVLDEAQAIKNPDSQVARAAFSLRAGFRLALSGTPVENRLQELWSLMHFTNQGLLGGRRAFDESWARPIAEGSGDAAQKLRRRLRPFVLRRLKREVAPELPPRTESVLHVTLDARERSVYDAVFAATRAEVVALLNEGGGVLKALEALLRLRQAACHPALVPGQHATSSSKVEALLEALGTAAADGHKALVFSQWTSLLDLIEPALKAADIPFVRLDGSTADRGAVAARFQSDDGPPVMLISLKAGGTGLNLTAADHVFLVDPWWNPAVEAQAADRAHRIGQERPVMVYRLVSQGTVEEKILGLQEKKRALFEAALGEASAATAVTRDDLLQLLA